MATQIRNVTVRPLGHAGDQWVDRADSDRFQLPTAFENAQRVDAPDVDGEAYLHFRHGKKDLLFVVREAELQTVLYADHNRLMLP
jgi:hypothetical protein